MVVIEEFGEELIDLRWGEAHVVQGVHHGRTASKVQQRGGSNLLMLRLQKSIVFLGMSGSLRVAGSIVREQRRVEHGL